MADVNGELASGGAAVIVVSSTFGRVSLESWAKFQALHIRHHVKQMHGGAD
jgi:hypothetical protein